MNRIASSVLVFLVLVFSCAACTSTSPASPSENQLEGRWKGVLSGRAPCVADWTTFELTLQTTGTGVIRTRDGFEFGATQVVVNGAIDRLDVELPTGAGECQSVQFVIKSMDRNASGALTAFSGFVIGRCCGTIATPFRFTKG